MRKIFSIDRIEGNIAVCISDDDDKLDVELNKLCGMGVHDVFSALVVGEDVEDVLPMPEERDRRIKANRERLQRLIERSKRS